MPKPASPHQPCPPIPKVSPSRAAEFLSATGRHTCTHVLPTTLYALLMVSASPAQGLPTNGAAPAGLATSPGSDRLPTAGGSGRGAQKRESPHCLWQHLHSQKYLSSPPGSAYSAEHAPSSSLSPASEGPGPGALRPTHGPSLARPPPTLPLWRELPDPLPLPLPTSGCASATAAASAAAAASASLISLSAATRTCAGPPPPPAWSSCPAPLPLPLLLPLPFPAPC
mmetsp:Transcript_3208/g.7933  ORF Transcript_3208/g.7933 Transcript_3208/m.7933 type:complete len:226 (-) Transcript_3208:591-1268(-)